MSKEHSNLVSPQQLEGYVPDCEMSYEDWLDWSGLDDSFVGTPDMGIPGTHDIYEAAIEALRNTLVPPTP